VRSGPRGPAAFWADKQLTSSYAPEREAQAWVDGKRIPAGSLVFVAGDPLGWVAHALSKKDMQAVALLPGASARPWLKPGTLAWAPEEGPLETFLADLFDKTSPEGVVWEVWPAFERQAPELVLDWSRRFRDHYRTVQGSWLTQRRFGPRFWHNALRNTLNWQRPVQLIPGNRTLVIAASGPSLNDGLDCLSKNRHLFELWALPSSFEALIQRGLLPDAGVTTDGGFYAREHLHRLSGTKIPVLAALGSAPDPVLSERPCLFFSQGLVIEQALLKSLNSNVPEVPSQGTVAITALRWALEATTGPVFIAGLDLAFRDLRGHTSPHTVDRRLEGLHQRLQPLEGLWAERLYQQAPQIDNGIRSSPALVTYAGWLRTRAYFSRTVWRIAPSAVRWNTMTEVSWEGAQALWKKQPRGQAVTWSEMPEKGEGIRRKAAYEALASLKARVKASAPDDPWLIEAARTAVPDALAQDFRTLRRGRPANGARDALVQFLETLRDSLS